MVNVSWEDATAYARWLSAESSRPYRLATNAEWVSGRAGSAELAETTNLQGRV